MRHLKFLWPRKRRYLGKIKRIKQQKTGRLKKG